MYYYLLHNLKIKSNIEISDLKQINKKFKKTDINIQANLLNPIYPYSLLTQSQIKEDNFLFSIKDVALFEIMKGNKVIINYTSSATPDEISLFLLGSCLGILLYQRNYLPIHASSIYLPNKGAVFFSGHSGAGKSTTLNAFVKNGYKMLSDDVSAIKTGNKPIVYPSFPKVKLWQDSADKLQISTKGLNRIHRELDKYNYVIEEKNFYNKETIPFVLYELNKYDGDKVYIEEIKGLNKIQVLFENTYRKEYLKGLKKFESHFKQISNLANNIIVKRIYRPENINSINEIVNLVESDLNKL